MPLLNSATKLQAAAHLTAHDPHLADIIARTGPCTIQPHTDYYRALTDSIIGQQVSVKAAAAIKHRFRELFGGVFPEPIAILSKTIDELRSAGLSRNKAIYVHDLAQHIVDGTVHFTDIDNLSDDQIIAMLTAVKGIGEWTAHMFLLFCMGRPDVLAVGDLGIRNGIRQLYQLDHVPTPAEVTKLAKRYHWHPYASVACWYIWRSLDNKPM